jgi:hypothetical protein
MAARNVLSTPPEKATAIPPLPRSMARNRTSFADAEGRRPARDSPDFFPVVIASGILASPQQRSIRNGAARRSGTPDGSIADG